MEAEAPKDIATVAHDRRAAVVAALVLASAGALSVALGQDANWDLRNYHLYAPWAFVTGRLDVDLAVAGLATYVNPLLDLPYFALYDVAPPRALAFAMGVVQGVAALVVYRIARLTLPGDRGRGTAAFVAAAGCCGSTFVSEFGNTMGDNATAAVMLGALAVALGRTGCGRRPERVRDWLAIGIVAGIGCGLKPTNATLALGLFAAVASIGGPWRRVVVRLGACAAGAAIGFAASYGWWFVAMWRRFHNPFFPQFNAWFGGPLASATIVADDKWAPGGAIEAALFPWSFTAFPMRIHEIPLVDALWPVVYAGTLAAVVATVLASIGRGRSTAARSPRRRAVDACFAFAAIAYVAWVVVFSIGRYLVGVELLLPLLTWLLVHRFVRGRRASTIAVALIVAAAAFQLATARTWGNADFAEVPDRVDVPAIDDPERATVLVMAAPVAWMFRRFPPALAYVGLDIRFPESVGYRARIDATIRSRGGPVYAILPADEDRTLRANSRLNALLARFSVDDGDLACRYVTAIFSNMPGGDLVRDDGPDPQSRAACRFRRDPTKSAPFDRDARTIAVSAARSGFSIALERCTTHDAAIGTTTYRYRFCPVAVDRSVVGR